MDQALIDKLMAGRALVDAYTSLRDSIVVSKPKDANTQLDNSINEMRAGLRAIGFGTTDLDDEVDLFLEFDKETSRAMIYECRPIQGHCDMCKGNLDDDGKETGPMCEKIIGTSILVHEALKNEVPDCVKRFVGARKSLEVNEYKSTGSITTLTCPYPHGYYIDESLCKPFLFNPYWSPYFDEDYKPILIDNFSTVDGVSKKAKDAKNTEVRER